MNLTKKQHPTNTHIPTTRSTPILTALTSSTSRLTLTPTIMSTLMSTLTGNSSTLILIHTRILTPTRTPNQATPMMGTKRSTMHIRFISHKFQINASQVESPLPGIGSRLPESPPRARTQRARSRPSRDMRARASSGKSLPLRGVSKIYFRKKVYIYKTIMSL